MIALVTLEDGRQVHLDGDIITSGDALAICSKLLKTWGLVHPKARAVLLFEVEPKIYSDCPHYDTLEEGLKWERYTQ